MTIINYAIEIDTGITGSIDASIGLTTDGYIRLITGRPNYNGTPTYPVWEDDSNNTYVWYQGIILDKGFSAPNRRIDIERGGNYGTVSGFSFKIQNTMKFWEVLENLDISLLNVNIQVFCVIDGKFYMIWYGIIENDPYEEITALLKCTNSTRKIHKQFPPAQISPTLFPKAKKSSYGNTIPVSLGNIPYAKLLSVSGNNTDIPLDYASGKYHLGIKKVLPEDIIYVVGCVEYEAAVKFDIVTKRKTFEINQLAGMYLTCLSGENAETEKLIQITGNGASSWEQFTWCHWGYRTSLQIASLYEISDTTFNADYAYDFNNVKTGVDKTWWFGIIDARNKHLVSNREIFSFKTDDFLQPIMYNYDRNKEDMVDAHGLISEITTKDNRDYIDLISTDINKDGTITYFVPHGCSFVFTDGFNIYYLANKSNATDIIKDTETGNILQNATTLSITTAHTPTNPYVTHYYCFDLDLLNFDLRDSQDIFIGMDLDLYVDSLVENKDVGVGFEFILVDMYERAHIFSPNMGVNYTYEIASSTLFTDQMRFNFLPTEYYKHGSTGLAGTSSLFGEVDDDGNQVRSYLKLPDELKDMIKKRIARAIRIKIKISSTADITISDIRIRQIGVFSYQETQTGNNKLFITVNGGEERTNGYPTYSVYDTLRHMLENYDGILNSNIDYGNTDQTRKLTSGWEIGRQVTQQKNSLEYYKELCQFAFLGMFQKRDGKLKITAFRERQTLIKAFNSTNIVRNSIKSFKKTSMLNVYNEFKLYYGYNPGSKKFDRSIGINNIDQTSFPAYLTSTAGVATEITSPNLVSIDYSSDGSGKIIFDADVSGILSIGDYISFYIQYGNTGIDSSDHLYYGYVNSVETTEILYKEALYNTHTIANGTATTATIYKNPSGTPLWMTYVEGLKAYNDSKKMWEKCNYAYKKTKIVKNAPDNIMKSHWFIDRAAFYNLDPTTVPIFSAPVIYLQNLIEWTTLPKNQVNISLPITTNNITLELLDYISFTDPIITNSVTLYGWITKIAIDMNNSKINIELTLISAYAAGMENTSNGNIIETGSADDTITESGSQTDTITESS